MHPTLRLLASARHCQITLFTRPNCSLCETAKTTLSHLLTRKPFHLEQIDITTEGHQEWKDKYEFDVPVIHVQTADEVARGTVALAKQKLMHRFSEKEVERLVVDGEARAGVE